MLKKLVLSYFSPTGGTKRAASCLAKSLAENVRELDLSVPELQTQEFSATDTIVVAAPVFGGRIPAAMTANIQKLHGHGARAIVVAVYGNRAYDDALLELHDCVAAQDFTVVAALGLIAEHSLVRSIAAQRPDERDAAQIDTFASKILAKLDSAAYSACTQVPGNNPYKEWQPMQLLFNLAASCNKCGLCAKKCPTQAIPSNAPQTLLAGKCTVCMRCVTICPQQARSLPQQVQAALEQRLAPFKDTRRENELFT